MIFVFSNIVIVNDASLPKYESYSRFMQHDYVWSAGTRAATRAEGACTDRSDSR